MMETIGFWMMVFGISAYGIGLILICAGELL